MKLLMVGAGLSGAVIGRHLAEAGHDITVVGTDAAGAQRSSTASITCP